MTNEQDLQKKMAGIFKALGHPARIRILQYLQAMDKCICGEIVDLFPLSQSTVSQHLKQLKNVGLIAGEVDGACTCYCLNKEVLDEFMQAFNGLFFNHKEDEK
jgi:ArsR family transcriptional regulator, arsenate/arsenite/antimonite-responsive transcriptional repressor